jgi:5-methylcytosine-specific restriction enzyme A
MEQKKRAFRTQDSIRMEQVTRDAVQSFLEACGYRDIRDGRKKRGTAITQLVSVISPDGKALKMRVRLCWRRDGSDPRQKLYSAAQLRAHLVDDDWDKTLAFIVQGDVAEGVTHTLLVQYDTGEFVHAALIPRDVVPAIWRRQRDISLELVASGKSGRAKKNRAMNGQSPTLWLQDDFNDEHKRIPQALWSWPGVMKLQALKPMVASNDDSMDDCPMDRSHLGRDAGTLVPQLSSGYPLDPKVRAAVMERVKGACERSGCGARRDYPGFLDCHHILGVGTSDRVWNCVALCPNCHREAHFAPDHVRINQELAAVAAAREKADAA